MRTVRASCHPRGHRARDVACAPPPWPTARARCARPARRARSATSGSPTSGTLTRVAYPNRIYKIRSGPGKTYRTVGKLRWYTEDRAPENYLVLRSKRGRKGGVWLQLRVPQRPNGSKGWVPRHAMGKLRVLTTSLEIDKRALKARLFDDGRRDLDAPASASARRAPRPRAGRYWIRERLLQPRRQRRRTARSRSAPPPTRGCRTGRAAASWASTAPTRPA